jgi:hypothetical protein
MDAATHAEAVLALWLSGVAVALVVGLAACVCHLYRGVRDRIRLLEQRAELPKLRQDADSWSRRVAESGLAADAALNGEVRPPAESHAAAPENGTG